MKRRILGHPIHQVLVVFPLGFLATSFFFDLAWLWLRSDPLAVAASWLIAAGVVGGAVAAFFGFLDWRAIPPRTRARFIGAWHGGGNAIVALFFGASWLLRRESPESPEMLAITLSGAGVALIVLTGWLGGQLADGLAESERC